jgi:hypothetical protein
MIFKSATSASLDFLQAMSRMMPPIRKAPIYAWIELSAPLAPHSRTCSTPTTPLHGLPRAQPPHGQTLLPKVLRHMRKLSRHQPLKRPKKIVHFAHMPHLKHTIAYRTRYCATDVYQAYKALPT